MIPLLDLRAQYAAIKTEIDGAVLSVLESGEYVLGREVERFEVGFAAYCGSRHAVAVNTGTSALHLALLGSGIGPGDEVITTPFTFVATVAAIIYAGARPVLVDIDPRTMTLDPDLLEDSITERTRAIIPVHLHGQMADMWAILEVADRHGLAVIEDACQAHGATQKGSRAGSLGVAGCFSFYPGKNLGACGEGGMVVTDSEELYLKLRRLRDWGQTQRYNHDIKGFNYRMDAIQGAILAVKLQHLERWTEARRHIAAFYDDALGAIPGVLVPVEMPDRHHVYHVYAIRSAWRDRMREVLLEAGVQTGLHYPIPVHLQLAHADLGYAKGDFPVAEEAAEQVLSLPIYPELGADRAARVAAAVYGAIQ